MLLRRTLLAALCCAVPLLAVAADSDISSILAQDTVMIRLYTTKGVIDIELDTENAPKTTENFVRYVTEGFYNGTLFHRVIPKFMVQGGGFVPGLQQKATHAPIQNEANTGLKNVRGSIAMARTGQPHSATAQFFINVVDNGFLDYPGQDGWGYAVFGKVVAGMDVVDAIVKAPSTNKGMHQNVPTEDILIKEAQVVTDQ